MPTVRKAPPTRQPPRRRRTVLLGAFLASAVLLLQGCDEEPAQRKAFIAFLQTRILDKPGVHVPRPTTDEAKAFGDYARHYAAVTDFHEALDRRVSGPMGEAMRLGSVHSIADLVARRADVEKARQGFVEARRAIAEELARAEAARAALQQPADLKPVYDAAFERDVANPAKVVQDAVPTGEAAMAAALDLVGYLDQHRGKVQVQGSMLQVSDPALQRDLSARLEAMNARGREALAAQQRLQALIRGG